MKELTAEDILNSNDLTVETVECPEWGGSIRIRALSGSARDDFERSNLDKKGKGAKAEFEVNTANIRARLVSRCAVKADGSLMFTSAQVELLGKKNAAALDRCFQVAQRLSGLTKTDIDEMEEDTADSTGSTASSSN